MKNNFLHIVLLVIVVSSCNNDEIIPTNSISREYAPLKVGAERIYKYKQIKYNGLSYLKFFCSGNNIDSIYESPEYSDTTEYELKEIISDYYIDLKGDTIFKIYRYIKTPESDSWPLVADSVWYAYYKINQYVRNENNVHLAKLAFPINTTSSWNINSYNTLSDVNGNKIKLLAIYDSLNYSLTVNNHKYNSVVKVKANANFINDGFTNQIHNEYYAYNIGMIKAIRSTLSYCNNANSSINCGVCDNLQIIDYGTLKQWELLSYK